MRLTWADALSPVRLNAEQFLGHHMAGWAKKFWDSSPDSPFVELDETKNAQEYEAVVAILQAEPESPFKSFYKTSTSFEDVSDMVIERIQVRATENVADAREQNAADSLVAAGFFAKDSPPDAHLLTKWVFHGIGSPEHADEIAEGFEPAFAQRNIWGHGIYFARDAPHAHQYTRPLSSGERSGQRVMILSLMVTGLPTLGNWGLKVLPNMYKFSKYGCFVDSMSNPEIFVSPKGDNVCPAYKITYSV